MFVYLGPGAVLQCLEEFGDFAYSFGPCLRDAVLVVISYF